MDSWADQGCPVVPVAVSVDQAGLVAPGEDLAVLAEDSVGQADLVDLGGRVALGGQVLQLAAVVAALASVVEVLVWVGAPAVPPLEQEVLALAAGPDPGERPSALVQAHLSAAAPGGHLRPGSGQACL